MNETLALTLEIIGFGGYIVGGAFAVYGIFDMRARTLRTANEETARNLIANLQATVTQQEKVAAKQEKDLGNLRDQLNHMSGRNSVLEDILKGRDPAMAAVFKEAPAIFEIARQNHAMSKSTNEAIVKLTTTLEEFLNRLPPLTAVIKP